MPRRRRAREPVQSPMEKMEAMLEGHDAHQRSSVVMRMDGQIRVLEGVRLTDISVGGDDEFASFGQDPALLGNRWEFDFEVESGGYLIRFCGGGNSYHGIASIHIDGEIVGTVDQYEPGNIFPTERQVYWQCLQGGRHTLQCAVTDKNPQAHGYWICMNGIVFEPVPVRRTPILTFHGKYVEDQVEVRLVDMSGNDAAVFQSDVRLTMEQTRQAAKDHLEVWDVKLITPGGVMVAEDQGSVSLEQFLQENCDCQDR